MPSTDAPSTIRVALIDDDSGLITVLERRFETLGWERVVLGYAAPADQLTALRLHALVVNPSLTGLEYLERVAHALPGLAILVCSSGSSVSERVRGLRGGADDWVNKPVHPEELVARVQSILRRRRAGDVPTAADPVAAGELVIRSERFDAFVAETPASLSRKEFELLHQLATADGRVLEREDIYQRVWGYTMVRGDRSVDVFVRKLRQKLERVSPGWRYVHTHFGVGYRFAAEPVEPVEPVEPSEPSEPVEPVEPAESAESAPPTGTARPIEGAGPVPAAPPVPRSVVEAPANGARADRREDGPARAVAGHPSRGAQVMFTVR